MKHDSFSCSRFLARFVLFFSFFFCKYIHIHIFFVCVLCILLKKTKIRPKMFMMFCFCCCFRVYVRFWLKYLKRTVIRIVNVLSLSFFSFFLCVLCEQAVPFEKQIVRFNTSHVHFVVFFSVLFHCSHRSVSLCRILFAKSYASSFFFLFLYIVIFLSVASVLV